MFLLHALLVLCVIYWISALIAETVMTTEAERKLAPVIRVGYGFFIILAYFLGAWLYLSIQQAWVLGVILLLLYALGNKTLCLNRNGLSLLIKIIKMHLKSFTVIMIGSLIFFAPLLISTNSGPFTEGGGDISIYSDTAKYMYNAHLTGQNSESCNVSDLKDNVRKIFKPTISKDLKISYDESRINPPAAEYQTYRIRVNNQGIGDSPFNFMSLPYVVFEFLGGYTNYPVYYGIQAFLYLLLLSGIWYFFEKFGRKIAGIAILLVAASHGLISVFYNMYSMHAIALASTGLILPALSTVRLFSRAGFRTFGSIFLIIYITYPHFLLVILPLILGVTIFAGCQRKIDTISKRHSLFATFSTIFFLFFWFTTIWIGSSWTLKFIKSMIAALFTIDTDRAMYLGDALSIFSVKWLSFVFGILSQQHFSPFVIELNYIKYFADFNIITGLAVIVMGAFIMLKAQLSSCISKDDKRFYLVIYTVSICIIIMQLLASKSSLYTQAKGAQNVLILLYLVMILPLGVGVIALKNGLNIKKYLASLSMALIVFIPTLLVIKIIYTVKLSYSRDRSVTLENSYFREAQRVIKEDKNAYVLVEPRKSSDVYLINQAFFGTRMMPTRHLRMNSVHLNESGNWETKYEAAQDLIHITDIPHLWLLSAKCKPATYFSSRENCIWKSEKLSDQKSPLVMLFADDYNRNIRERKASKASENLEVFSYVRYGSAILYIPAGGGVVEVAMQPDNDNSFKEMAKELMERKNNNEFGKNVILNSDGHTLKLIYTFLQKDTPTMQLIAFYKGDYWLNVKFNNIALN